MVSEYINSVTTNGIRLTAFVQDSNALDEEEDVKSMEFGGDIKMKKTTRKVQICFKVKIDDF